MKKLSFKEKLEIVRNIIRESLSGNAAFALLVYSLLHSLPIKTFADLFVTILLFIAIIAVVIWLFLIIYVYFCELFRSHWIAVWFILWSVVINLTIGFGIYDKLAPVISLMKQEIIWQHTYTYDIYYKEDKRAQQINSFIIWSCKEITNNPHDKQAGTCKKTQIPCMHI